MATVTVAAGTTSATRPPAAKAAGAARPEGGTTGTRAPAQAGPTKSGFAKSDPAKASAAVSVDLSAAARTQLARLAASPDTGPGSAAGSGAVRSFDEVLQDRTTALADKLSARLRHLGIPPDEPIKLKLDDIGRVTTDSPYKEKIETLFKDDPDLAKAFKDVAALNAMKAAQKALEAFETERKAARDDDARDAAYGLYTARLMRSQELSGTMTLEDGTLRSASVAFMAKSLGEAAPAEVPVKAGAKAEQAAAQRVSRTV